jgi:hypothetical protein
VAAAAATAAIAEVITLMRVDHLVHLAAATTAAAVGVDSKPVCITPAA